ncbi:hypothetical protein [Melittangium boletus]|uniref:Uncharacterized protein n=1 Tax=Melittangium boletus DSM 14713 TaxID=1294270 RepID=A0A250ILL5_9BACT|nr:hypothetical protein [Melittangium boletus]ATB32644.1 hypothetical protein MEBOL_006132 [Melittangium boletus DSM 14713]
MRSLLLAALLLASPALADSPLQGLLAEYETGPAAIFQNDGRYGPTGTPYSAGDFHQDATLYRTWRASLEARLGERHGLILLYAPFEVSTRATLSRDIDFRGTVFPAGSVVDHRYLFDGYRASYLYRLVDGERFRWDIGASVQIRNALVGLSGVDGTRQAQESDIGVVGAVKTRLRYTLPSRVWAGLEADALSTFGLVGNTTGGIYDLALTLGLPLDAQGGVTAYARLRWLGGGADVTRRELSNWANFGFALVGIQTDLVSLFARRPAVP